MVLGIGPLHKSLQLIMSSVANECEVVRSYFLEHIDLIGSSGKIPKVIIQWGQVLFYQKLHCNVTLIRKQ